MIVLTDTTIGIQCAKCGEVQFKTVSVFDFSHFNKEGYCCSCGAPIITLTSIDRGNYSIEYPCIYCGESHYLLAKRGTIWGESLLQLSCREKEIPLGYIGPRTKVENSCRDIKKTFIQLASELVNDEEAESEFDNFFIVYGVMEKLGKMVERGQLGCCCGNYNLAVEILSDRIEILCELCQASGVIYTDNKEVLRILDGVGSIFLEENMKWFLNDAYKSQHLVKNK
ncbi:MAG: hypothetical protein AWM53_01090 [Candidatus Dichloromethanomonas elyunquensis]|nr:MAG: hypothetical protein AWM53_01090 [Candidatus Dichloromethanomonas elyunquensis]